jgi:hypothetical protein
MGWNESDKALVIFRVNTAPKQAELIPVGGRLNDGTVMANSERLKKHINMAPDVRTLARTFSNLMFQVGAFTDEEAMKIFETSKFS